MDRSGGRTTNQMRPVTITPRYTTNAHGSVLVEFGQTKVICTAFLENSVPSFLRNVKPPQGWLSAEYSMLPGSTHSRSRRERNSVSGRSQEIQRLIGRSLRAILDLSKLPEYSIQIDCDVIQADGGTRTAAITGAYVALEYAIDRALKEKRIATSPILDQLAAVSVGIIDGNVMADLDYQEDSNADIDMNIVMTKSGKFLELQGTAEKAPFDKAHVNEILDIASDCLQKVFAVQQNAMPN